MEREIDLNLDSSLVSSLLTSFIDHQLKSSGLEKTMIGLSGGVDSSLVALLACKALGAERVKGVMLPHRICSDSVLQDARTMVEMLGIEVIEMDITPMIDAYYHHFPGADKKRRGNKMARERMAILYDLSSAERALVLGTENKTEYLLGYSTLWGDMAAGLHPLGDLYKTQVFQLAEELGLPEVIVRKPPSADLWPGQTDEEELGFSYDLADQILYLLVEEDLPHQELVERGYSPALVNDIMFRLKKYSFKRRMPLIAPLQSYIKSDKGGI